MSSFEGGGKAYPGKPDFMGADGTMTKVTDATLEGTGKNVPDHVEKKPMSLDK